MSETNLEELGKLLLSLPTNGARVEIYKDRGEMFVDISECRTDMLDSLIRHFYKAVDIPREQF